MNWFKKKGCFLAVCALLSFGSMSTVAVSGAEAQKVSISTMEAPTAKYTGWKTTSTGSKRYLIDGKAVTGIQNIDGITYVFSEKGYLRIDRGTIIGDKKYLTNKKGELERNKMVLLSNGYHYYAQEDGSALINGWKDLEKGRYYFGSTGIRYKGNRTVDGVLYAFGNYGYLMKNKWVTKGDKYYRTDSEGRIIKSSLIKVGDAYYYVNPYGVRYQGKWKTFPEGKSYFLENGKRATGVQVIGNKTYYFNASGYLEKKVTSVTIGNTTYYLDDQGLVKLKMVKGTSTKYYGTDGKEMRYVEAHHYITFDKARKVAAEVTKPSMTQSQKLKAVFDWVVAKYYRDYRTWTNYEGWPADFADDHFDKGRGDCHSDAAAFAYLARAVGYTEVYVCSDGLRPGAHSWAEIDGKVYDPLFWQAKRKQSKYYGGSYGGKYGYELSPRHHTLIP